MQSALPPGPRLIERERPDGVAVVPLPVVEHEMWSKSQSAGGWFSETLYAPALIDSNVLVLAALSPLSTSEKSDTFGSAPLAAKPKLWADFGVADLWIVIVPQLSTAPIARSFSCAFGAWDDLVSARKFEKHGILPPEKSEFRSMPPSKNPEVGTMLPGSPSLSR